MYLCFQALDTAGYVKNVIVSIQYHRLPVLAECTGTCDVLHCVYSPTGTRHVAAPQTTRLREKETNLQSLQGDKHHTTDDSRSICRVLVAIVAYC